VENLYLKLLILTLLPFATLYLQGVGQKHSAAALLVALATGRVVKSFFTKGLHRSKCHFNHFAGFCTPGISLTHAVNPTMIKSMLLPTHARQDFNLLMRSYRVDLNQRICFSK
jgi:uncharacterized membrane protein